MLAEALQYISGTIGILAGVALLGGFLVYARSRAFAARSADDVALARRHAAQALGLRIVADALANPERPARSTVRPTVQFLPSILFAAKTAPVSAPPAKPVTPPGMTRTQDGNLIRKAA